MKNRKALLVVDVQNDFCPGGSLAVPQGDKVVPVLNKYIGFFAKKKWPVFVSLDWHPVNTKHFQSWPHHCIQNTPGAKFHPRLKIPKEAVLLYKGMDPEKDSYSVFQAQDLSGMPFAWFLARLGIKELYVGGLATDYCVRASVLDALKQGFKVKLLTDAVRGVDLKPKDSEKAIKEMARRGAKKTTLKNLKS